MNSISYFNVNVLYCYKYCYYVVVRKNVCCYCYRYCYVIIINIIIIAVRVFESGIPITVVNDTVTNKMWWGMRPPKKDDPLEAVDELNDPTINPCAALMQVNICMSECVLLKIYDRHNHHRYKK